jgi:arabinofuranosyltransferase
MRFPTSARPRLAILSLVAIGVDSAVGPRAIDDAYITLRYARSIAEGQGFVYNPGQHVLGTTTPLFALLIAALHLLTHADYVVIAFALAVLGHAATAALLGELGMRCGYRQAGWVAALLFALAPLTIELSVSCMETSLFLLLIVWVLMPSEGDVPRGSASAVALAVLLRPEGGLLALCHGVRLIRHGARRFWRDVAVTAALVLPWVLFATYYFGSPVPHSLLAKWQIKMKPTLTAQSFWNAMVSTVLGLNIFSAPRYDYPLIDLGFWKVKLPPLPADMLILSFLTGSLMLLLACLGALRLWRARQGLWLLLFSIAYACAFIAAGPFFFLWYALPIFPGLFLSMTIGADSLLHRLIQDDGRRRIVGILATVAAVMVVALPTARLSRADLGEREEHYRRIVEWLGPIAQDPAALIAAVEIGTPGYFSRARMLDLCGLVSPELDHASAIEVVERIRPEAVITAPLFLVDMGTSATFRQQYRVGMSIPRHASPFMITTVFVRRDVTVPSK